MLIYYRLPGVIASFALIYYTLVVLAIFRLIPVTLTLAGIAGFVLSVGMAVDANILIFERIKEELRVGKTLPAAVEAGFGRGLELDPRLERVEPDHRRRSCTWFGSSTIRGFALVLIIGVLVSMFTRDHRHPHDPALSSSARTGRARRSYFGVTRGGVPRAGRSAARPRRGEARARV